MRILSIFYIVNINKRANEIITSCAELANALGWLMLVLPKYNLMNENILLNTIHPR